MTLSRMNTITTLSSKIVLSALFYYKEEMAADLGSAILPQMVFAAEKNSAQVHLVLSLNYPFTPALWEGLRNHVLASGVTNVKCTLIERGYNIGFGAGHRHVFESIPSDVFIVINSDLFCEKIDWIATMSAILGSNGEVDLVGAEENQTALRSSDGCGIPYGETRPADFVDGSLLGFRSETARRLGLFSPDILYFYFEDSDLVLRYRQAGARVTSISVPHKHLRWSSSQQLPRYVVKNILDRNRGVFFSRWGSYLERRQFSGRLLADLRLLRQTAWLDALPALLAITQAHPGVIIDILLPPEGEREFFQHSQWNLQNALGETPYDRHWQPTAAQPQDDLPAPLVYLRSVSAAYPAALVRSHLEELAGRLGAVVDTGGRKVLIAALAPMHHLDGVVPPPSFFLPAVSRLRSRNWQIRWLSHTPLNGQDTADYHPNPPSAARDWLSAVSSCSMVLAGSPLALQFAQYLGKTAFAVSGAQLADRFIWAWDTTGAFARDGLDCLGCQHVWGRDNRSFCLRRDEACLHTAYAASFADALDDFLRAGKMALAKTMAASQKARLHLHRSSLELDLSRWPED